jgi:hypothetical protein
MSIKSEDLVAPVQRPDVVTPYLDAFRNAWTARFQRPLFPEAPAVIASPAAAFVAPMAVPAARAKYKKNAAVLVFTLIFALLAVIVAAANYVLDKLTFLGDYSSYVTAYTDTSVDLLGFGTPDFAALSTLVPYVFAASAVLALVTAIVAIAALASKKRLLVWIAALLAFVFGLGVALVPMIDIGFGDLTGLITPDGILLGIGFFILLGCELAAFILSCFGNKKAK